MRTSSRGLALGAVLLASAVCLAAAPDDGSASSSETRKPWALEIAMPLWIPGNYGTLKVHDRTSKIDVSPGDMIDLLTSGHAFAGAGYFDFRYDRVFAYVDAVGGYADESVSESVPIKRFPRLGRLSIDANAKLKQVLSDFGVGYRLGAWTLGNRKRPFTLDVFGGARYYWFLTRVRASASIPKLSRLGVHRAADVSQSFDWADPLIGVRWEVPVLDCVSATFRGDIGGFGAGSDLSWNLVGGFRYWVPYSPLDSHPYIGVGYRALSFDRSDGSDGELDLEFRGPYGSMGFVF